MTNEPFRLSNLLIDGWVSTGSARGHGVTSWEAIPEGDGACRCLNNVSRHRRTSVFPVYLGAHVVSQMKIYSNAF